MYVCPENAGADQVNLLWRNQVTKSIPLPRLLSRTFDLHLDLLLRRMFTVKIAPTEPPADTRNRILDENKREVISLQRLVEYHQVL